MLTTSKVKSYLKLVDLPNFSLRIETREPARAASMEGRRLSTDDATYPGLPLLQLSSFETRNKEGEKVICESIELRFSSKEARGLYYPMHQTIDLRLLFVADDLSQYLEVRYNRAHSPASA
jgi:hypothetical protein